MQRPRRPGKKHKKNKQMTSHGNGSMSSTYYTLATACVKIKHPHPEGGKTSITCRDFKEMQHNTSWVRYSKSIAIAQYFS